MAQGRNNSEYLSIQADKADTSETKTGEIISEEETSDIEEPTQYETAVTVNVRSEPDKNSEKSGYLSYGDVVTGTEEFSGNWVLIYYTADGSDPSATGWVYNSYLTELNANAEEETAAEETTKTSENAAAQMPEETTPKAPVSVPFSLQMNDEALMVQMERQENFEQEYQETKDKILLMPFM